MKKTLSILSLAALGFFGCQQQQNPTIRLVNTLDFDRSDVPVTMSRSQLKEKLQQESVAFPQILTAEGQPVPCQWDDLNGDGQWDQLAFVVDIPAKASVEYQLKPSASKADFNRSTQIYMAKSPQKNEEYISLNAEIRPKDHIDPCYPMLYQYEGIGWENDKVAFRSYFDARNGKDIFGKRISDLILQDVGIKGTNYHNLADWGMDVLKVGTSLGSGAIGMEKNGKIYRLGITEEAKFRVVAEGPARAIAQVDYKGWKVDGQEYDITELITIWKGQYYYESQLILNGGDGSENLLTGVVNYKADNSVRYPKYNDQIACVSTFSAQAEDKEDPDQKLGMAVMVHQEVFKGFEEAPSTSYKNALALNLQKGDDKDEPITDTYLVKIKPTPQGSTFRYYACWELSDDRFKTAEGFNQLMKEEAEEMNAPLLLQ